MEEELKEIRFKIEPLWQSISYTFFLIVIFIFPAIVFDISSGIYALFIIPIALFIYVSIYKKISKELLIIYDADRHLKAIYIDSIAVGAIRNLYSIPILAKGILCEMFTINKQTYIVHKEIFIEEEKEYREKISSFYKIVKGSVYYKNIIYNLCSILISIFFYILVLSFITIFCISIYFTIKTF